MIEFKEYEGSVGKSPGPDLTPLIDMVFLLLIFFLLTSFLVHPSISVNLPQTTDAELTEKPEVIVTILENGRLLFNGRQATLQKLSNMLRRSYTFQRTREVVIQSDREVTFERVVEVMDISRNAGAENISFLVERRK